MAPKKRTSRTNDRFKRTRKAMKNNKKRRHTLPSDGAQYTWCLNESETEELLLDLDVSVLRWPDKDVRDSSQDFAGTNEMDSQTTSKVS
jgi:hypothetical protein